VIEPLKELYKDEVRVIGEQLGLEKNMVWRHPFPGPGLAVRCLCAEKTDLPKDMKKVSTDIQAFLKPYTLSGVILPIKSVGVQGDGRTYRHPLVLSGKFSSWEELGELSTRLTNKFSAVNRVLWACTPEKVSKPEIVKGYLTPSRIDLLQDADRVSMKTIASAGLQEDIWQFPTVLIPVSVNGKKGETVVLRPVSSTEAMTANFYPMPAKVLRKILDGMKKLSGVSAVMYDITHKPPGTIEWE
jgi:GMP synthase (glutamine-hydrolysing)